MDSSTPSHRNPFTQNAERFKGRLVVIEGMDGTGKNTQSKLFIETLQSQGYDTGYYSFPDYDSPTGKKVRDYLNSKETHLTPFQRGQLYAEDRLAKREALIEDLRQGKIVVCDRYFMSNAYNILSADILDRWTVRKNLERLELVRNKMPVPHLTFILDLPPQVSSDLVLQKGQRSYTDLAQDRHEADLPLQEKVRRFYLSLQDEMPFLYQVINCQEAPGPDEGQLRSRESIHRELWERFRAFEIISSTL